MNKRTCCLLNLLLIVPMMLIISGSLLPVNAGLLGTNSYKYITSFKCANTVYCSVNGNDANDGLTESTPKKNPIPFLESGGYKVLLKSGDTFKFSSGICINSNTQLSIYGGKKRATIDFTQQSVSSFEQYSNDNNIFRIRLNNSDIDTGWIRVAGAKNINWQKVDSVSNLKKNNDFCIDESNHLLLIKSNSSLSGQKIEYALDTNGIQVINDGRNIIIDNIEVTGIGKHGISICSGNNILVNHCYVHDIGSSYLDKQNKGKYGNGIQIWATDSHNVFIVNNYVENCYDAGITAQITNEASENNSDTLLFEGNYVKNCNYCFEFFQYGTTYSINNMIVRNNVFEGARDISNGYRDSTAFTSFMCIWGCDNNKSDIDIYSNYGYNTSFSGIAFGGNPQPWCKVHDNYIACSQHDIKNGNDDILSSNTINTNIQSKRKKQIAAIKSSAQ